MSDITPEDIRAIRRSLGLTQVAAGELLGGGPRAFTKYEAGTVKPAASVINLLRLLEANPAALTALGGTMPQPIDTFGTQPFEVTGGNISALRERDFPLLLRKLLSVEAQANSLPADGIHVASNIYTPDGGEDGRIEWTGGPERTLDLPSRLCQFQLKAGGIKPAAIGKDVLTRSGLVKDMVNRVLVSGGHYILLCAQSYTQKEIELRESAIRKAIRGTGVPVDDDQVDFKDADQIANWVNRHSSVATWVKERTQVGAIGPFRSWNHWAGVRTEHSQSPLVEDERLPVLRDRLRALVAEPRKVARVVGLSGIGKSRLILEALGPTSEEKTAGLFLRDFVMYAVKSEARAEMINETVQNLADTGARAVVVVDNCDPEAHQILAGMVLRQGSRLSLVTIDHEIPIGTPDENTLKIDRAPDSVIDGIINHVSPGLPYEDRSRLERFSKGFPKITFLVGQTWGESRPVAHATDDCLVDEFVLGRNPRDRQLLLKSAELLAAFPLVVIDPTSDSQLSEVASLGRNLSPDDLYAAIALLVDRGVALRRGKYVTLQPRPIAMRLAERQWKQWPPDTWDRVLSGDTSLNLNVFAARQLALLNTTEVSQNVVAHVCRYGGLFDGLEGISGPGHAEVLSALAEINSEAVAEQIERSLSDVEDLTEVGGEVRRPLVRALEKIAFHSRTFEDGARLLLRLASAEHEILSRLSADVDFLRRSWDSNAAGKFKGLFPMFLGGTEADGDARLSFLDEAADTGDPAQRVVVAEGLIAGCEMLHFERILGPESQGSLPALEPWRPTTNEEHIKYVEGCVTRLTELALKDDKTGVVVRTALADALSPLVVNGFIDRVESVVRQVTAAVDYWPEALRSLRSVLSYHAQKINPEVTKRVRTLVEELQPKSLESRIRSLVTEMPWNYSDSSELEINKQYRRQVEGMRKLAAEALQQPTTLKASLAQLSRGQPRMALEFGAAVAELASSPAEWLEPFIQAVVEVPEHERNYDLLAGFVIGLDKSRPNDMDTFKQKAARSRELAPAFLRISWGLGITESDIQLAICALQDGLLPPQHFMQWSFGGKLAEVSASDVAPLFDTMLDHSAEAFMVAVQLMGMYSFGAFERLEEMRPQVLKLADNATRWQWTRGRNQCQYHFEQIIDWMLAKGRQNPDACATALALAKALVNTEDSNEDFLVKGVLSRLLSGFPEIAWPLIGQAIVSDQRRALRLRFILGNPYSFGRGANPVILNLPEDTLFAWCHAHTDRAPAFLARTVPVLTTQEAADPVRSLHPVMTRLLDEFGEREDVQKAVEDNIHTFGGAGSMASYYAPYKEPLGNLLQHAKPRVRRWAKAVIRQLDAVIKSARNEDEQRAALTEI